MNDTCRNISDVKQITSLRVRWAHKRAGGLTKGILQMPASRSPGEYRRDYPSGDPQASSRRWLITAFLIYATIVVGTLGLSLAFPDAMPDGKLVAGAHPQTVTKAARYEAVIANWNRYRAKDARAEAR